jgi:hypothetical protein
MNPACAETAAGKKSRHKDKKEKKTKRKDTTEHHGGEAEEEAVIEKKKKKKNHTSEKGEPKRKPTVSIAIAGSIIDNAQSLELATLVSTHPHLLLPFPCISCATDAYNSGAPLLFQLAGQIARAAAVFRIDEIVVFDGSPPEENGGGAEDEEESGARFLIRILEYLETPQYLRRRLFPMHKNFKYVVRDLRRWLPGTWGFLEVLIFVLMLLVCRGCFRRWMRHTMCASMSGLNFVKVLISLVMSLLSILVTP